MLRVLAVLVALGILLGAAGPPPSSAGQFKILGASVQVDVVRGGVKLPATLVPFLEPGDTIDISFSKGVQFSRSPRWHLVVADMYENYLKNAQTFPIPDANLSAAKPGHVWSVRYDGSATPIIFLVPENGGRHGHGIPEARAAIGELGNRALLAKAALFSASAAAKKSTLDMFLGSLSSVQPGQLSDGRVRVTTATQSLFGYDLGNASCFNADLVQSTQDACAAQALASGYQAPTNATVTTSIADQLSINAATYGMLIAALYQLLAKRRVQAQYSFVPGAFRPGSPSTDVYVNEQPQYYASGAKPSTIVYFQIGSEGTKPTRPSYGAVPKLPVCLAESSFNVAIPFSGLPVYFRKHTATVTASGKSFAVPATYDTLLGYNAKLSSEQMTALHIGGTLSISSLWGFDQFASARIPVIEPRPAPWQLDENGTAAVVQGEKTSNLTFTDGTTGMGSCVKSISAKDGLGHDIRVTNLTRAVDTVTATFNTGDIGGANGSAIVTEDDGSTSKALTFTIAAAMPSITSAIVYLPRGILVLRGTRLKYIKTVTLQNTGIVFGNGAPATDGSWEFSAQTPTSYQDAWEHETMAIRFTLQPPDSRTDAVEADVEYEAATPTPAPTATGALTPKPVPTPA